MAFLKKYSDVIENYERLTQILDQAENVLQGQKVAEGAEVRSENARANSRSAESANEEL